MKQYLNKNLLIIILLVVIGILFYMWNNSRAEAREQSNLVESLNADLQTWKDKDSLNHARIQIIETQRTKDFLAIQTNDSLVKELQSTVNDFKKYLKKQGSVTIVKTTTDVSTKAETEVIPKDTVKIADIKYVYPEYRNKFNLNGWVTGNTIADKDTTLVNLKIKNDYSVIIGQENQGLFKKKKPFVEVINKNPYIETEALRTYEVSMPRPKRFGIGPMIGVGLGADGNIQGVIGVGIQYNLIKF